MAQGLCTKTHDMDLCHDIFHLWYKSVSTTLSLLLAYPKSGCYTTIQDSGSSCVGWGIGQLRSHVQNTTTLWLPSCAPLPPRFASEKGGQSNLPKWQDLSSSSKPPFFDPKKGKKIQFHKLFSWAWRHKGMTTGLLIPPCLPLCKSTSWGLMIFFFADFQPSETPRKTSNIPAPRVRNEKQGSQVSTIPFGKWLESSTQFPLKCTEKNDNDIHHWVWMKTPPPRMPVANEGL